MALGQLGGEGSVVEDRLDGGLAGVEVAAEAEDREVLSRLRDHLQLLQRRDAGVGVVHADPGVGAVGEAVERRHAGVAAGRHQDEEVEVGDALGVGHLQRLAEVQGHALQRHVLERQRRAVPELEDVTPRGHVAHRGDLGMVEVGAVGPGRDLAGAGGGDIEAKRLVHGRSASVVGNVGQRDHLVDRERREPLGHEQAAAGSDPLEDRLRERAWPVDGAPGVQVRDHDPGILHNRGRSRRLSPRLVRRHRAAALDFLSAMHYDISRCNELRRVS